MRTLNELKPIIKDAIWELKNSNTVITVKNVFDKANGEIEFNELPIIGEYLRSVKHLFLYTECKGYLELTPFGNATVADLISNARN